MTNEWWPQHCEKCELGFDMSSPAMKAAGSFYGVDLWKIMIRYVTAVKMVTKGYNAVKEMKPYEKEIQIEKEECINHVVKRLGKELLVV